jgi:atypical dual specificity phosphatase
MVEPYNFSFVWNDLVAGSGSLGGGAGLVATLESLAQAGVSAIVSLTETPLDFAPIREFNFDYLHAPIQDFTAPTIKQIKEIIEFMSQQVDQERCVLVHCQAGIGRTGTILACFLVSRGVDPAQAIHQIREQRPGSLEVYTQEFVVHQYAKHLQGRAK